jgi:hypothetical protein
MSDKDTGFVRVASYYNVHEARIFKTVLEDNEIPAQIFNENLAATPGSVLIVGQVTADVMVQKQDAERALELLKEFEASVVPDSGTGEE